MPALMPSWACISRVVVAEQATDLLARQRGKTAISHATRGARRASNALYTTDAALRPMGMQNR